MACKIFPDQGSNSCPRVGRQILIYCTTKETQLDFFRLSRAQPVFSVLAPMTSFHVPILATVLSYLSFENLTMKHLKQPEKCVHSFIHLPRTVVCICTISGMKMWWWWHKRLCLLLARGAGELILGSECSWGRGLRLNTGASNLQRPRRRGGISQHSSEKQLLKE